MDWLAKYWWVIVWGILVLIPMGFAIKGKIDWKTLGIIEAVLLFPFALVLGIMYLLVKGSGGGSRTVYYENDDQPSYRPARRSGFANRDLYSAPGLNSRHDLDNLGNAQRRSLNNAMRRLRGE